VVRLKKATENNLISITIGWEKLKINPKTGSQKWIIKKRTIMLTPVGAYKN
jgi:hypothetical protein